ncbi:MAG: hypothetical protein ABIP90_07445 [Vicinamibacterales bacterium]
MRSRLPLPVVVTVLLALLIGAVTFAQGTKASGAATPQEAVAVIKNASTANDMMVALPVISPRGLKVIANEGVTGVLMVLAFSDPDDAMPGSAKPAKAELDAQRRKYQGAVDLAKQVLKPYGLDTMIGKPVLAADVQKSIDAALDKADNTALIKSLFGAMVKMGPMLGMKEAPKPDALVKVGNVSGYKIDGDKATAQNGAETMDFVRIDGRWFIEPPAAPGAPAGPAEQSRQAAAAPRASAGGKEPEIVAGGVQVVRVAVPDSDFSAKPFHEDNGTKIVLWVKMPTGQGLIEIDEDASLLQSVADDKGTNMGGKFGSFPEEFKDGTGGIIEIASTGFAAPGATALLAEGSLAMTIATGTRKTKVANVKLVNDAKFNFGQTSITVAEVETQGDTQTFTLKLPRQVMTSIKNVVFLDAKGQPIEGRRTSSGYMNDNAEVGFSVKTAARTLTLEFEAWQGLKTIKVPFKVRAGLGLN